MKRTNAILILMAMVLASAGLIGYALAQDRPAGPGREVGPAPGPWPGREPARPRLPRRPMDMRRWPGPRGRPPMETKEAERMGLMIGLIQRMKRICFDPEAAGVIAAAGIRDEVPRKPEEVIKDLEDQLTRTKTLGLRNAIRLSLKDIYKHLGQNDKVLEHLRAMLAENDAALQAAAAKK